MAAAGVLTNLTKSNIHVITLPGSARAVKDTGLGRAVTAVMMGLAAPAGSLIVLLAESDVFARNLLTRELSRDGYFVLAASNADEALRLSRSFEDKIQLLLCNNGLPERPILMDTILRERPGIRLLILSAPTHGELVRRGREPGSLPGDGHFLREAVRLKIRQAMTDPNFPDGDYEI
jgi:CheY-like chemotaxis protein